MMPAERPSSSMVDDFIRFSQNYICCVFPNHLYQAGTWFICSNRKRIFWKTVAMTDGRLFQDASCMKMHVVCHACHRRSLDVDNSDCYQERFFILLIISATIMALHWNFLKMKKTNYIFCSLEWSLMTTQHMTVSWDVWCLDCC